MDSHHGHLARGFNWLGGATIVAKVLDFSTILAALLFLTKEQVGVASLVVSIAMVVEAFDGLGTGEALVQARSVSRLQLDTLFWFVIGAAALVAGLTLLAAPGIAAIYGVAGMQAYFISAAIKQPLVGAALIPLAMMSRDLQYERIAIVNVFATWAAALTRLGLAVAGTGAWAIVGGYAASGLYVLIGALLASSSGWRRSGRWCGSDCAPAPRTSSSRCSRLSTSCWSDGSTGRPSLRSTGWRSMSQWNRRWRWARWSTGPPYRCSPAYRRSGSTWRSP